MINSSRSTNVFGQNPFLDLSTKIISLYSDAIRQNMENLNASSAKIIQEQAIQAWTNAAESCSRALAQNAISSQQTAIARIVEANQKAFGIMVSNMSPFKVQPMAGFSNWFPAMANGAASPAPSAKRIK